MLLFLFFEKHLFKIKQDYKMVYKKILKLNQYFVFVSAFICYCLEHNCYVAIYSSLQLSIYLILLHSCIIHLQRRSIPSCCALHEAIKRIISIITQVHECINTSFRDLAYIQIALSNSKMLVQISRSRFSPVGRLLCHILDQLRP